MRRFGRTQLGLSAAVLCIALLTPCVGFAAESTQSPRTARPAGGTVDVQFWMAAKPDGAVAIVSYELEDSVKLPAVVQIPIVTGMVVDWAGEISDSGDINQDIERTYTIAEGAGGKYVEMELTEFRVAQIDLSGKPMTVSGSDVSAVFEFVQSAPSSATFFSVRVPAGASDVKTEPAAVNKPTVNSSGETLYTLPSADLDLGAKQAVSVSYSTNPAGSSSGTLNAVIWGLVAAVIVVLIALVWFTMRQRAGASRGTDDRDVGADTAAEPAPAPDAHESDDRDDPFLVDD